MAAKKEEASKLARAIESMYRTSGYTISIFSKSSHRCSLQSLHGKLLQAEQQAVTILSGQKGPNSGANTCVYAYFHIHSERTGVAKMPHSTNTQTGQGLALSAILVLLQIGPTTSDTMRLDILFLVYCECAADDY